MYRGGVLSLGMGVEEDKEMKPKEILQLALTAGIAGGYIYLVIKGKASVEGFLVLAVYVIKKFLDIVEDERKKE